MAEGVDGGSILFHDGNRRLQMIARVRGHAIFPDCPRYIPAVRWVEPSPYTRRRGHEAPEPARKSRSDFADCVHPRQPLAKG